jgi:putative flippase GtrA
MSTTSTWPRCSRLDRRLLRFALVGGSNTLVTVLSYSLLIELGLPYLAAAVIGYAAGILNGYTWNRIWTFETGPFHLPEFSRYVVVQASGLALNLLLLLVLIEGLGMPRGFAEILSVVPIVLVTYSLNRSWTFRQIT